MRKRSQARAYALQMLYQVDLRHADVQPIEQAFWQDQRAEPEVRTFASQLVEGTIAHLPEINALIAAAADNWDIKRMAVIDRNILRLGIYELLYLDETPPKVCLNEAIELAKRFGDAESGKFINGILDAIHRQHAKPSR